MANYFTSIKSLPKEKQAKICRLVFNPKAFREACKINHEKNPKTGQKYYTCPQCGYEDKSLSSWKKVQTSEEKWNHYYNTWYKKKKLEKHFKALKDAQAKRPLTTEELYAKLEGLKSFSRITQLKLDAMNQDMSELRQSPENRSS